MRLERRRGIRSDLPPGYGEPDSNLEAVTANAAYGNARWGAGTHWVLNRETGERIEAPADPDRWPEGQSPDGHAMADLEQEYQKFDAAPPYDERRMVDAALAGKLTGKRIE